MRGIVHHLKKMVELIEARSLQDLSTVSVVSDMCFITEPFNGDVTDSVVHFDVT